MQGTSSGAPSSTRNVSSILLRTADGACLVDAGEGTCRQLAAAGVPADHLRWCARHPGPTALPDQQTTAWISAAPSSASDVNRQESPW